MNDLSQWGLIITTCVVLFGLVIGVLTYVSGEIKKLEKTVADKAESNYNLHEVKIESLREHIDQRVERVAVNESKARHDMTNNLTAQLLKLEGQVARIGEQAVKKEDLSRVERAVETLVIRSGATDVIAQRVQDLAQRFEKFLDSHERRSKIMKDLGE